MANQHPPTPPEVEGHELQDGFHQLLQHNARSQQQPYGYSIDNGSHITSGNTYNTPEPELGQWFVDQYGNRSFMYHSQNNPGSDIQYDGYGQSMFRPHQSSIYPGVPQHHQYPNPAIYSSPPPPSSDQGTPPRRTTRQRGLATSSDSRHSSPKPKRKAGKNNPKPKTLSGPLSELTKDMDHIPIKDTETWVNRSVEDRRLEAKKDGFVKRPSNSFILYRSAYADRARSFQKSANHQIVSSIAGESWGMEPPEIRKQYDSWAKIERENHAKAFPEYKFQPQTNKASARKRKGRGEESDEEESDLDSDYAYEPKGGRALKSKKARSNYRDSSNTPSGTSLDEYDPYSQDGVGMFHPSSYQMTNPGKPLPIGLNQLAGGQYYQATSHPNQRFANYGYVEDVTLQATDVPTGYHQPAPPVIGIPGAFHHELQGGDDGQMLGHLDPMLASYDQGNGRFSISNGHAGQNDGPQTGSYPVGACSPGLNDFESEHGDADFGSDEWWKQNKDR